MKNNIQITRTISERELTGMISSHIKEHNTTVESALLFFNVAEKDRTDLAAIILKEINNI